MKPVISSAWAPYAVEQAKVVSAITEIQSLVYRLAYRGDPNRWLSRAEVALFLAQSVAICPAKASSQLIEHIVEQTCDRIPELPLVSAFNGQTGQTMMLQLLPSSTAAEERISRTQDHVCRSVQRAVKREEITELDFINGLVGAGLFLLVQQRCDCRASVDHILDQLWERGVHQGRFNFRSPEYEGTDLGIAHGIVAILQLAAFSLVDAGQAKALRLLTAVVDFLHQSEQGSETSLFGYFRGEKKISRLGWCYGDLSVAASLVVAGKSVGSNNLVDQGLRIARHAARRHASESGIGNSGLCHGSLGVAHCFQRIYTLTGDWECGGAARFWLSEALDAHFASEEFAGDLSFLEGRTGQGLALISSITAEAGWDILLGLSRA